MGKNDYKDKTQFNTRPVKFPDSADVVSTESFLLEEKLPSVLDLAKTTLIEEETRMAENAPLVWDKTGERFYETGIQKGVLYPQVGSKYPNGVAWNGLISVSENPSGAEPNPMYADDIKYLNLFSVEEFGATIECYAYPPEFGACNGEAEVAKGVSIGQQDRKPFGMSYRTTIGNDTEGNNLGYKIHLIYGAMASPSERTYNSINDSPEPGTMSFELSTTPIAVAGQYKPTAYMTIDSRTADQTKLQALEKALYGSTEKAAYLPLPDEVIQMLTVEEP